MGPRDSSRDAQMNGNDVPAMLKLNLNMQMSEPTDEACDYNEIDEPVSPPACNPEEGPPLLFSQTIEELASEVVDENKSLKRKTTELDNDNIPKTVQLGRKSSIGSLIPVTVSEISENPPSYPYKNPSTLHMSGGMVSTDVTQHMASVPTSVITANTSIENKLDQDEGIDKILQYFIQTDKPNETAKAMDNIQKTKSFHPSESPKPSTMFHNLPLDLSITKLPKNRQGSTWIAEEEVIPKRKTQKEVTREVSQKSRGVKRSVIIENEGKHRTKKWKQDTESLIEIIPVKGKAKDNKVDSQIENIKEVNDVDCKLILPRKKEEKARLVFSNGMFVEIERELFSNFEQNIVDKKTKCRTNQKKTEKSAKNVNGDYRRKKAISRRQSEKLISIDVQKPIQIQVILDPQENVESLEDKQNEKPKDMPMIFLSNNEEMQPCGTDTVFDKKEQLIQYKRASPPTPPTFKTSTLPVTIISSNTTDAGPCHTPPTPPPSTPPSPTSECKTPPPPPAAPTITPPHSPPSPSGLHRLPSIVSKPSYYAKTEGRKVWKTK